MANIIQAKIYKSRAAALKYANKVRGHVVVQHDTFTQSHGRHTRELEKIFYVVYRGAYIINRPKCYNTEM
jgi:hypothetical protein